MLVYEGGSGAYMALHPRRSCDCDALTVAKLTWSLLARSVAVQSKLPKKVTVYGELSGITGDELSIGTKLGAK